MSKNDICNKNHSSLKLEDFNFLRHSHSLISLLLGILIIISVYFGYKILTPIQKTVTIVNPTPIPTSNITNSSNLCQSSSDCVLGPKDYSAFTCCRDPNNNVAYNKDWLASQESKISSRRVCNIMCVNYNTHNNYSNAQCIQNICQKITVPITTIFQIINSWSTNSKSWIISIKSDGRGNLRYANSRNLNENTNNLDFLDPNTFDITQLKIDLTQIPNLSSIKPLLACPKSISFGALLFLEYKNIKTGDLSCDISTYLQQYQDIITQVNKFVTIAINPNNYTH